MRPDISQVPVPITKEADVAYLGCIETNPMLKKKSKSGVENSRLTAKRMGCGGGFGADAEAGL